MEENGERGGMVKKPTDRDVWSPSKMDKACKPLKIRSFEPAKHWTDALPIGNGRLGGMIWGGVASHTINLNDDTLWTGNPGNYTNSDAPKVLSEVRKLVHDGKYAEATKAAVNLSGNPSEAYQLLGDIMLDFDESHAAYDKETYERELDLDIAIAKVKYTAGGINFSREHFSSSPDKVLVTNISGSKPGSLSFTIYLDGKLHHESRVRGQNQIMMEGGDPIGKPGVTPIFKSRTAENLILILFLKRWKIVS